MLLTLQFDILILAPRTRVWSTMLDLNTYEQWTTAFCEGSTFVGGWNTGDTIDFIAPGGDGMFAVIDEARPLQSVSIKHLGEIHKGQKQPAPWAPAFERYRFTEVGESTRLDISVEVTPDFEAYMRRAWPEALARLRRLCEAA